MLLASLAILSLSSCATKIEQVAIKPDMPTLLSVQEIVNTDVLDEISRPLDLIPQPKTVDDILYNMSEFRRGYINWRRYATALEDYYDEVASIINKEIEEDGIHSEGK